MTCAKRFIPLLFCAVVWVIVPSGIGLLCLGCSNKQKTPPPGFAPVQSYRDIPGVTAMEIAAIEKLQRERGKLIYGMIPSTEAFVNINGEAGGYAALFCEWLTGLFGIPFQLEILPTNELLDKLNKGQVDFSGNMMPSEERRRIYQMTDAIAERQFVAIRLEGSRELDQILHERPLRYVFLTNIPAEAAVAAVAESGTYEPVWAENYLQAYLKLKNGEADAYITTNIYESSFTDFDDIVIENFFPLIFNQATMAAANPGLEPVISVVTKAIRNGAMPYLSSLYNQGYRDYQKDKLFTWLSNEEYAYINRAVSQGLNIPIAADSSNYPLSFYNEREREWQGLFFDLLGEISSLTGLSFRVSHNANTNFLFLLDMLKKKEVAFFPDLIWTKEREDFCIWSDTIILNDYYALISRSEYPNIATNEIKSTRIGLPLNTHSLLIADTFRRWFPNHQNTFEYNTMDEAFSALQRGEIDMVMSTQRSLMFLTHYQETAGFKINMLFDQSIDTRIGFNKDEVILRSIIDKTLRLINIGAFSARWTQRTYDFRAKVMEARLPWLLGAMILSLAVLALTLVFYHKNRKKNKRLEKLGMDLHAQGEQLKALNSISSILLEPDIKNFDDILVKSLGILGRAMNIDHLCIWENYLKDDQLYCTLVSEWSGEHRPRIDNSFLTDLPYDEEVLSGWEEKLSRGECISSLRGDMSPNMQLQLESQGILSVFVIPVFVQGAFWGYLGCDGCAKERIFTGHETDILRSAGLMLSNAIIRNEMTIQLKNAREQAEQSNRSKSVFLSHMSHEIRTPMNAVLGIAEIQLQNESTPPETAEAFEKILDSGNLLLNLINDILDLSKIESGRLELIDAKYEIPSLINDTAQLNRLRYENKPIRFKVTVDENTPIHLIGDELRIKQVLNNILSNAFKYTDEGEVIFSVSAEQERGDQNENVTLVFKVSDSGQGMTEDQLKSLFDEYARFNLKTNRTILGAGLGMSITKRLVGFMNGSIHVESKPGKGTDFTVRIPQKRIDLAVCGAELVGRLSNFNYKSAVILKKSQFLREYMPYGSVLVVDDVESNLYVAKGMLSPYGLRIETVLRAQDVINRFKSGKTYDIIFMDHMMPEMDGIEATKILRGAGYTLPIIALTANTLIGQKQMFLQNGFDGFISKPIDSRELDILLNEYIRNRKPPETVEAARKEQQKQKAATEGTRNADPYNQADNEHSELKRNFVRDAKKAVNVLENMTAKIDSLDDTEMGLYVITVHGIKSALANIGEKELSGIALKLEKAGRERESAVISNMTPQLLDALKSLIKKLSPAPKDSNTDKTDDDMAFLRSKLNDIKKACDEFDSSAADAAMNELQQKSWPENINSALDDIAVNLLHSSFDKAANAADELLKSK